MNPALLYLFISLMVSVNASSIYTSSDGSVTFALSVAQNTNDLFFQIKGTPGAAWVAVGTGSEMQGSQMFMAYTSADGNNVTLSSRLATDHNEPSYSPNIKATRLHGSGIINGSMILSVHCQNCTSWSGGSLDLKSTSQSWIWAVGDGGSIRSDDLGYSVQRHIRFGKFQLDMLQASGDAAVPHNATGTTGSTETLHPKTDTDYTTVAHAVFTCGAFIVVMPLAVIFLRVLERVRWHWVTQLVAFLGAFVGGGIGIYLSTTYNKSSSFNSAHQIIGILVILALVLQVALGWYHHRAYKRTQKSTRFGLVHRYFGQTIILIGIVNGALGLSLADNSKGIAPYVVVSVVIVALTVALVLFKRWRANRNKSYGTLPGTARSNAPPQYGGYGSDINLGSMPPCSYSEQQTRGFV